MRYSTSWSDGFVNWLKKLPGPYWASCLIPGIIIFLLNRYLFSIADFSLGPEAGITYSTVLGLFALLGFGSAYSIYILGVMPAQISSHFRKTRPILKVSEEEFKAIHDQMTFQNTTGWSAWLGQRLALLLTMITLISVWLTMAGASLQIYLFIFIFTLSLLLLIFLSALVLIKIFAVLRQVVHLQFLPLEVNILNPFTLFVISRLTQTLALYVLPIATAVGFLAISLSSSTWRAYAPSGDLPSLGEMTILISLILLGPALLLTSLFIFIFPVLWIRRLIIEKKEEALAKLAARLQETFAEYTRRTTGGEWPNVDDLKASVEFLTAQEERYQKITEWPWEGRIFRQFMGALVIPILIWVIELYLQKFIST